MVLHSKSLLPFKVLMVMTSALLATGSLIYAVSVQPWMVIVSRFFLGASGSLPLLSFMWYCVASVEEYNDLCGKLGRPLNHRLKRQLTIIFSVTVTTGYVVCIGNNIVITQFVALPVFVN